MNTIIPIIKRRSIATSSSSISPLRAVTAAVMTLLISATALARTPFAASSRLAKGRWVRVEVSETGMQIVTNSQLRSLGLDPAKTRVYGHGGRMVPENFPQGMPDDLPMQPSVTVPGGIVFFGTDNISWTVNSTAYSHTMHPYSAHSYYFLSDTDPGETPEMEKIPAANGNGGVPRTTFRARRLHEQELFAPSNTGRNLLGEDFRAQATRVFAFDLPDAAGDASVNVRFAARTTNGVSTLTFKANGETLPATNRDKIPGVSDSNVFMSMVTTNKKIEKPGEKLSLQISYSGSGSISLARLDWIELEYERHLRLRDGQLYFYGNMTQGATHNIEGCSTSTRIWDVTDPAAPREMEYTLSGTTASLVMPASGYRELVAFDPEHVKRGVAPAGTVGNQDIHSLPVPDMVIITPTVFRAAAERLAEMHRRHDGMTVHVLAPEKIYNEFSSGSTDIGAFRKMMKMWQVRGAESPDNTQIRYCLIMGRPTYDNKMVTAAVKSAGFPRVPIWQSPTGFSQETSYSTDDITGMLDYGMSSPGSADIHVAVGRLPVTTATEADEMVTKIINHVEKPEYGSWRNQVLLIADDGDYGVHLDQSKKVHANMLGNGNGANFHYNLLYLDSFNLVPTASGNTYPAATESLLNKWNEGVGFINYIGHANPSSWSHEKLLTWEHITNFSNSRLPILYAACCEFTRWDDDNIGGAEIMLLNPHGGFVGGIIPSRSVYIGQNGILNNYMMSSLYERDPKGHAKRIGDVMRDGKNKYRNDDNKLRYCLLSDPALKLISPEYTVQTDSVAGVPVDSEAPTVGARARISIAGHILDPDGNPADDFNGVVEVTLYDAERAVTTNGNGDKGEVMDYNDRPTRLATESVVVKDGKWETVLNLPAEIENNFSPALLSFYAYSDSGVEANGMCDNLYVYGYDENATEDLEGPRIELFTLNHDNFESGDVTHSSPIVMAAFSDESGINLSNAAIGHDITLLLDGKKLYSDVSSRYVPDPMRDGAGSVTYPLANIEPGSHTLMLKVWDNAGNSSSASILFQVAVNKPAGIASLNIVPTDSGNMLTASLDRPSAGTTTLFEVLDLNGGLIWSSEAKGSGQTDNTVSVRWDCTDNAGHRVARNIYVCRATVTTEDGVKTHASNKIAVAAE